MTASFTSLAIKLLRILMLVALFMAMAGIGTYLTITLLIKNEDTVIVPELAGKDVLVGLEMLSDLGLNTRVKGIRYDDRVARHHIIEQDPSPGSAIKRGREVKIQVSRGPESIVMPNLTGLSLQQSRILLTENGLCLGNLSRMHSSLHPADQVMGHYPRSRAVVNRHKCVDLIVSQGARSAAIPTVDLIGLSLEAAIKRLEQRQLHIGRIRSVHVDGAPLETVVTQTPPPGYRASVGGAVDLTVNRQPSGPMAATLRPDTDAELFRFRLEDGFLNRRVQVKMNQPPYSIGLYDEFMTPGQEIWLLVPKNGNPTILVYVDGQLADSQVVGSR